MGRKLSPFGSAAEAQTPPASVPQPVSPSDPIRQRLERCLAQQRALADFARRALRASALEAVIAEGAALARRFPDEEDLASSEVIADVVEAVSGRLHAAESSRHAALHDPLTGLANRSLILDHLDLALKRADRRPTLTAVVFLDLDDFKRINDTYGHIAGAELLVGVAERLRGAVRPADTVGRWGGDEFVVVCNDLEQTDDVHLILVRIATAFERPFDVHGTEFSVVASIGVAVSADIEDPSTLIAAADSEMYRYKRRKGDRWTLQRDASETITFPARSFPPKQERLTLRLLELLSSVTEDS
jgi:diguanylate cyclase (GGDEF)-like protein